MHTASRIMAMILGPLALAASVVMFYAGRGSSHVDELLQTCWIPAAALAIAPILVIATPRSTTARRVLGVVALLVAGGGIALVTVGAMVAYDARRDLRWVGFDREDLERRRERGLLDDALALKGGGSRTLTYDQQRANLDGRENYARGRAAEQEGLVFWGWGILALAAVTAIVASSAAVRPPQPPVPGPFLHPHEQPYPPPHAYR